MRSFFAVALAALAIGGASLPAEAAAGNNFGAAGAHVSSHEGISRPHLHLARTTYDDDDDVRPSRRWRMDDRGWERPRYSKQRYAKQRYAKKRHARSGKRSWRQASRHAGKSRRTTHRTARGMRQAARRGRIPVRAYPVQRMPAGADLVGVASYYWQGQRTATGGWFNPNGMTAAHRTLPFGTRVRVTHLGNGRSVEVRINDRGPYIAGRIIDLSKGAAGVIGMHGQGIARVKVTVLGR
jgi:rare lipoprotein A